MLHGWILAAATTPAPAVVYFGGNAEEVSWALADKRWPRDVTVVALNYRGYGTSEGKPSAEHLQSDGLALYDLVAARSDVDRTRIAVSAAAWARRSRLTWPRTDRSRASSWSRRTTRWRRSVRDTIRSCRYRSCCATRFAPAIEAPRCRMPLLAIVAPRDSIIPVSIRAPCSTAWAGPKEWLEIPDADHNTLGATRELWSAVTQFLR
jgi:hypothetical protein